MSPSVRPPRAIRLAATLLASPMAGPSDFADTTVGFAFEVATARGVDAWYDRLRWDDGSTWVGRAVQPCPRPRRPLDRFDPGGTILARPTRPAHPRRWNALGSWRVTGPADDPHVAPRDPGATSSTRWACPSWLVLLAAWGRPPWRLARRRGSW